MEARCDYHVRQTNGADLLRELLGHFALFAYQVGKRKAAFIVVRDGATKRRREFTF